MWKWIEKAFFTTCLFVYQYFIYYCYLFIIVIYLVFYLFIDCTLNQI